MQCRFLRQQGQRAKDDAPERKLIGLLKSNAAFFLSLCVWECECNNELVLPLIVSLSHLIERQGDRQSHQVRCCILMLQLPRLRSLPLCAFLMPVICFCGHSISMWIITWRSEISKFVLGKRPNCLSPGQYGALSELWRMLMNKQAWQLGQLSIVVLPFSLKSVLKAIITCR